MLTVYSLSFRYFLVCARNNMKYQKMEKRKYLYRVQRENGKQSYSHPVASIKYCG